MITPAIKRSYPLDGFRTTGLSHLEDLQGNVLYAGPNYQNYLKYKVSLSDLTGDGKVDVADINAIIKIMKDGGGTSEETIYYSYVGTDTSSKLVDIDTGALKSDIATQIKTMSGVKTYTSIPSSLTTGETIVANSYVYVIAPTSTLNNATTYLVNQSNMNIATETLGTFTIESIEYTVKSTPSEASTVVTAWK